MQIIDLLLLNHFHPVISYRQVRMESDELFYTVWSLVTVRNQLPAQGVNQDASSRSVTAKNGDTLSKKKKKKKNARSLAQWRKPRVSYITIQWNVSHG